MRRGTLVALAPMFLATSAWGAEAEPIGSARAALEHPGFTWRTMAVGGCRVHYQPGTFAARHIAALARSADGALVRAEEVLEQPYDRVVDVFYINSRDEMETLMGLRATGFADSESSAVFLVCTEDWRSFDLHEIAHIVSIGSWGPPAPPVWWIREGLAVHADSRCLDRSVDAYAAEWLGRGELPTVEDLVLRFQEQGEMRGYLGSGSLVGFLVREFGMDSVREIWTRGGEFLPDVLGMSFEAVDARWRAALGGVTERPTEAEWKTMLDVGCG